MHLEDWVGVEEQQLQRRPRKRAGTLREERLGVDGDQVRTKAPQGEDKIAAEDGTGIMWEFPRCRSSIPVGHPPSPILLPYILAEIL